MDALDDFVRLGRNPVRSLRTFARRADDDQVETGLLGALDDLGNWFAGDGGEFGVDFSLLEQLQTASKGIQNGVSAAGVFDDSQQRDFGLAGGRDERAEPDGVLRLS